MKKSSIILGFIMILAMAIFVVPHGWESAPPVRELQTSSASTTDHAQEPVDIKPSSVAQLPQQVVNAPEGSGATIRIALSIDGISSVASVPSGSTVLDAMRKLAASGKLAFEGREYPSLGYFVESINGKKYGGGFYWFLYINGRSSDTGASQTTLEDGDAIEWRYEKKY